MKHFRQIAIIVLTILAIACSRQNTVQHLEYIDNPVLLGYHASSIEAFDEFLASSVESSTVSNAAALIVQHGKIIYHKSASERVISPRTRLSPTR